MGTIYITQEDVFIAKNDERIVVKSDKEKVLDVPLIKVDGIVVLGRATVSPALVSELLERKIPLSFLTDTGKYLGKLEPELTKNIFVRAAQWKASGKTPQAVHVVQGFVRGKLKNYRTYLSRMQRESTDLNFNSEIQQISKAIASVQKDDDIDRIRGFEGAGSAAYFSTFNRLIRTEKFEFKTRHRPATDPVNSLLNFGYTLLRHDVQSAVNIVGFDPYLGYLHYQHYGRPSLALDLMEEFRPLIVDTIVINAINRKILTPEDFQTEPLSQVVRLTDSGRREFLKLYAQRKQVAFTHPVIGRKYTYQKMFEIQARLLAKYLMGESEQYPPLVTR
jgi:CRISP-associated protein Cas1